MLSEPQVAIADVFLVHSPYRVKLLHYGSHLTEAHELQASKGECIVLAIVDVRLTHRIEYRVKWEWGYTCEPAGDLFREWDFIVKEPLEWEDPLHDRFEEMVVITFQRLNKFKFKSTYPNHSCFT